tara:strand:- start:72328 stop:72600 length:273 start_codon:yes stop_codon:yes gene_type:complete
LKNDVAERNNSLSRRSFMTALTASTFGLQTPFAGSADPPPAKKTQIVITFDLEMSCEYPQRKMREWDFQKGNLNQETNDCSHKTVKTTNE